MQCPKCQHENDDGALECLKCGIVFAKYKRLQEDLEKFHDAPAADEPSLEEIRETWKEQREEFICRVVALPAALIFGRVMAQFSPFITRLVAMLVHESGHAVSAWFCGYNAIPGLWETAIGPDRYRLASLFLAGMVAWAGWFFWRREQKGMVAIAAFIVLSILFCATLSDRKAEILIVFGGDAGSMVLGTVLMMTIYAPRWSRIYQNQLRWGFLGIGALGFMDAYKTWTGSIFDLPFGEQNGEMTDPSKLNDLYGWSVPYMMSRYVYLAEFCLAVLAITYVIGLVTGRPKGSVVSLAP